MAKIFYSSSACVYPEYNQEDQYEPNCEEHTVYPAQPDSNYGWEKLFSERLYFSYSRNYKIPVAVARYHNIWGHDNVVQTQGVGSWGTCSIADNNAGYNCRRASGGSV